VRYDPDGTETARWGGFTAINGLAVDDDGEELYVSQIFGNEAAGTGNVVRVDTEDETWTAVDVPFPSGVAVDDEDEVFVSAYSLSPADADDPSTPDVVEGGQVWRFSFPKRADEAPLPVTPPPAG
jgi:DNA-binding beta-propeller fold protein YncE